MADKLSFRAGSSAFQPDNSALPVGESVIYDPGTVVFDDEDEIILDSLHESIMKTVFTAIADAANDGELLPVLHLTWEILEAEETYGPAGHFRIVASHDNKSESTIPAAVKDKDKDKDEDKDADNDEEWEEDFDLGDLAGAAEYYDCFEGTSIAVSEGHVQLKRRSL